MEHGTVRVREDKMQTRRFKINLLRTPLKHRMTSATATHSNVQKTAAVLAFSVYELFVANLTMQGSLTFSWKEQMHAASCYTQGNIESLVSFKTFPTEDLSPQKGDRTSDNDASTICYFETGPFSLSVAANYCRLRCDSFLLILSWQQC